MPRDERRMTFIVVPHGGRDLNSRSFEVSYRRLRIVGVVLLASAILWVASVAIGIHLSSRAARVPILEEEVARLRTENVRIAELASTLQRLEGQYEQMRGMLGAGRADEADGLWLPAAGPGARGSVADSTMIPTAWPLAARGYITRGHLAEIPGQHPGIDIAVAEGSFVTAAGGGVVTEVGEDEIYGRFIRIQHADGFETVYGHASEILVAVNDTVTMEMRIARSGNTGRSTAPHLHFEVWKNGQPIDPRVQVSQPPQATP